MKDENFHLMQCISGMMVNVSHTFTYTDKKETFKNGSTRNMKNVHRYVCGVGKGAKIQPFHSSSNHV